MRLREAQHRFVAIAFGLQTVGAAIERGRSNDGRTGGQQHRQRRAHRFLVLDQILVCSPVIMRVLMNVDDRVAWCGISIGRTQARRQEHCGRRAEELAAVNGCTAVHVI